MIFLMKEFIIFLINNNKETKYFNFIKENIKSLNFDPYLIEEYIKCPNSFREKSQLIDKMNSFYEDMPKK